MRPIEPTPRRPRRAPRLLARLAVAGALAATVAGPTPARAADLVEGLALSAGAFNVLNSDTSAEGGLELRLRPLAHGTPELPWVLRPAAGAMATTDGAVYGYAGFRLEVPAGELWTLTVHTAGGVYEQGDEKDLGGSIQFRSGLELAYQVSPGNRVGAVFYHLSNAGLERPNPGSESLVLFWSWH